MSRRLYKRCLVWLLPLLVAQALVPVGFMVGGGKTGLHIAFCPVQSAQVIAVLGQPDHPIAHHTPHHHEHIAHHATHASDVEVGDSSHYARSNACPFALAATAIASTPAAPLPAVELIQVEVRHALEHRPPIEAVHSAAHRVRGPPLSFS
jgi:hypothetical protein